MFLYVSMVTSPSSLKTLTRTHIKAHNFLYSLYDDPKEIFEKDIARISS